jgi:hypothetical protein
VIRNTKAASRIASRIAWISVRTASTSVKTAATDVRTSGTSARIVVIAAKTAGTGGGRRSPANYRRDHR